MIAPHQRPPQPAFTLSRNDLFHAIMISEPVLFESAPETESILSFFIIRRNTGFSITHIFKTFQGDQCISKSIQEKHGISEKDLENEINTLKKVFTGAVEEKTGYKLEWHVLKLKGLNRSQQIRKIEEWGKLSVFSSDS